MISRDEPTGTTDNDLLLEGTTADRVQSASVVQSSGHLRWAVLGAVGLGVLLFGLAQWPAGDATSPDAQDNAAAAVDGDENAAATDSAEDDAAENAEDATEGEEEPEDSGNSSTTQTEGAATGVAGVGGPLVGEPTGLGVIYGSQGFGRLKLLELDSGVLHDLEATGDPLGVIGSSLVTRRSESVSVYPLDSIDAEPVIINGRGGWVDVVSISEDRIWTVSGDTGPNPDGWMILGYDETGVEVDSLELAATIPFYGWDPSAEFVQGEAGGIYRRDGGGFERVSIGTLAAAGDDLVLANECDERLECRLNWYDVDNWDEPLDLPTPDLPAQGQARVSGNDRWLVATNWVDGSTEIFDVQTGELVRTVRTTNGPIQLSTGLSPDGRWLIDPGFGNTVIVDLESGVEWPQDVRGEVAVFVDLAVVGFAGG